MKLIYIIYLYTYISNAMKILFPTRQIIKAKNCLASLIIYTVNLMLIRRMHLQVVITL